MLRKFIPFLYVILAQRFVGANVGKLSLAQKIVRAKVGKLYFAPINIILRDRKLLTYKCMYGVYKSVSHCIRVYHFRIDTK